MDHMDHDIHDFVRKAQGDLQAEYLRIRKRATEDPGTAGDQGEENWAALLREWLPDYFQVVTKGRILTDLGYASPQIDVLVLYPSYPKSSLLSGLFSELAWVFTDMRQLEEYFRGESCWQRPGPNAALEHRHLFRENPRSITKGAVMAPASASVNLNSTTKARMTNAISRERNSEKAP